MYLRLEEYLRPATTEECLGMLGDETTALLAGGTRLNVAGHQDLRRVVDIQALPLGGLVVAGGAVRIGALTPLSALVEAKLSERLAALVQAARAERNLAIRNQSTVGGRLARDRSDGRLATAVVALGGVVEVAREGGTKSVPAAEYVKRDPATFRASLLTSVELAGGGGYSAYADFSQAQVDAPTADAALCCDDGGEVGLASGGHGAGAAGTVALAGAASLLASLDAASPAAGWQAKVRAAAMDELPAHSDDLAGGEYRRELAATLVVRLVEGWLSARGGAA